MTLDLLSDLTSRATLELMPAYHSSTVKKNNPGAVSGIGVGTFFTDLRLNYPNKSLNYSSAVHLTAPTGDTKKGFSTGHATWSLANHFDHAFGDFSPFLDAGVGNTVMDTRFFHRPFTTFGYNAQFNGGVEYDPGNFSFSASAYAKSLRTCGGGLPKNLPFALLATS